jgi:signal transduction histidine kinase
MRQLQVETDEQMLALCESLLRAQTAMRCRRAFMHDIRNPAQSIQSGLELLERVVSAKTTKVTAEQCITLIRQSLGNLQRTIEKTLDSIAPLVSSATDINVRATLEEFNQLLINDAAARGIAIRVDVDPTFTVRATLPRVKQALLSLLVDALDAVDTSGTVTVAATRSQDACILQLADTRASDARIADGELLDDEQWWDAVATLIRAENGTLERERTADRYIVRLKLPCGDGDSTQL